jgi:hypothetical protein
MPSFQKREDLLNLVGEDFYQFYRRNRNDRYSRLTDTPLVNGTVHGMFSEMLNMLEDCNHGIVLKGFGVVAPKDFVVEDKESIFRVRYKKKGYYSVFLESEYLSSKYRVRLKRKYFGRDDTPVTKIRKPRPYAVLADRKNLRKNKLRNENGED